MKKEELINKIIANSSGTFGNAYTIGGPFYAMRIGAPATWAIRAIKVEEHKIILGHVTWNLKGQIESSEELSKYDSLRQFETMGICEIEDGLKRIMQFMGIED